MMRLTPLPSLALLLMLAACTTTPKLAAPAPQIAAPAAPPAPLAHSPLPGWELSGVTPGSWIYRDEGALSAALFGLPASPALLVLRCARAERRILIQRATPDPLGTQGGLQVETTSQSKALQAAVPFLGPAYLTAELSATDPLWDAIAFSRGRWRMGGTGTTDLILPRSAEVSRIVEDCRAPARTPDTDRK